MSFTLMPAHTKCQIGLCLYFGTLCQVLSLYEGSIRPEAMLRSPVPSLEVRRTRFGRAVFSARTGSGALASSSVSAAPKSANASTAAEKCSSS